MRNWSKEKEKKKQQEEKEEKIKEKTTKKKKKKTKTGNVSCESGEKNGNEKVGSVSYKVELHPTTEPTTSSVGLVQWWVLVHSSPVICFVCFLCV
jgi:hypothetical protein